MDAGETAVLLQCLVRGELLLSKSSLSCLAARFLVLWLKRAGFSLSAPVGISRLLASASPKSGIHEEKKTWGTHCYVISWVPSSLADSPSSFHISESYACCTHNFQGFLLCIARGVRKSISTPSSQKLTIPAFVRHIFNTKPSSWHRVVDLM